MRNLSKTLAVLSLLAPASAQSLGIGDIKLHSALNQNLNAEIALILSPGEKASDIKVNLAPPDKFDEAGVPWNYFLSKIKFEPVVRPNGTVVIKLSSREALKEPFLGLLLEVSWPKGSLYREFSVLVDPPEAYEQATIPVVTLPNRNEPEQEFAPPRETVTRPVQKKTRSYKVTGSYGPIRRNDTLWNIAERASSRQSGVSVEQMMIAIYQENPNAFFKENINALQAGKTLKIPKREAVLKLSRKQALAEYDRHVAAWKNRTDLAPLETEAPRESAAEDTKVTDNQLTLAAPSEASVTENAVITPGQEQATSVTKTADATRGTSKSTDNNTVTHPGDTPEGDALQNKMLALQKQLANMQEQLALKDQQLAALQNQSETQPTSQPAAQPAAPVSTQPSEQTPPVIAQQIPAQSAPALVQPAPEVAQLTPVEPAKPAIEPAPVLKPKPVPVPEVQPSYYITAGSIGLGILSVLGWLWWRKRKVDAKTDTASMFAPSTIYKPDGMDVSAIPVSASAMDGGHVYSVDPVGESSFLSEFTPSDFDAFDTDQGEIDPISEADVYLAYGRYQQAEELMRQAIVEQPDRDACKLKLLEIFYANENKKAFETYANELAAAGKKSDTAFWEKVIEMGQEICPDSTLFLSEVNPFTGKDDAEEENSFVNLAKKEENKPADFDISDAMGFEGASFNELLKDNLISESTEEVVGAPDYDLSSIEFEDRSESDGGQKNNQTIEFDLDSLSTFTKGSDSDRFNDESPEKLIKPDEVDNGYDLESFDFDVDGENPEIAKLDNLDLTDTKGKDNSLGSYSLSDDISFDFDLSGTKEGQGSKQNDVSNVSDLTDMDEFETKLDLARAYLDMGDDESAKEILEGVLENGSEEQKKIAQKIVDNLA